MKNLKFKTNSGLFSIWFFLIPFFVSAQKSQLVFESTNPYKPIRWMLLQKLEGGEMMLMHSLDSLKDNKGTFVVENLPYGEYAVQYDSKHIPGLRFIYSGEDVHIRFDPDKPHYPYAVKSGVNKKYFDFLRYNRKIIKKLLAYKRKFKENPSGKLQQSYQRFRQEYYRHVDSLKKNTGSDLLKHFVAGKVEVLPDSLKESKQAYVDYALKHYFDQIDLNDTVLFRSHVILDRLTEYIFKIPFSGYGRKKSDEYIRRLKYIFDRLQYMPARASFIKTFMALFSLEDAPAQSYLSRLYEKLPGAYKNDYFAKQLRYNAAHVRGASMDIKYLKSKTGIKILPSEYYLVVFYSSDCPHCQSQLPVLYDFLKKENSPDKPQVIAIGLEDNPGHWKAFSKQFTGWINTYVTGADIMNLAGKYYVEYTPTFFFLNKNFEILEKTDDTSTLYKILNYYLHGKTGEEE